MPRRIKMPSLSDIRENYEQSGAKAQQNYEAGVAVNDDQHERAFSDSAERNYNAAMQKVLAGKTRQKMGKSKSSQDFWKSQARNKGAPALGAAIPASGEKLSKGYAPIREALDGFEIADRTTDPYQNVDNILKAVIKKQREAAGKE